MVEDDGRIRANVSERLRSEGFVVECAADGVTALAAAAQGDFELVVLDLSLPRLDGLEVARGIRAVHGRSTLVLMLTARDQLDEKLAGFDAGADDYLVKPFAMPELLARIAALRARGRGSEPAQKTLRVSDLVLDPERWRATRAGRELNLNRIGYRLLRALLEKSPAVLTREECEAALWDGFSPGGSVLRTHIYALRRAIDGPGEPALVHTVRGIGYRIGLGET